MSDPTSTIKSVLSEYFDALYFCDTALLQKVFHPRAIYATADETPLLYWTMEDYVPVVARRQSPASRGERRNDVVDEIQLAGDNTAFARVRCSIGDKDFVDLLTLVRDQGTWKIMAKIFQIKAREEGAM